MTATIAPDGTIGMDSRTFTQAGFHRALYPYVRKYGLGFPVRFVCASNTPVRFLEPAIYAASDSSVFRMSLQLVGGAAAEEFQLYSGDGPQWVLVYVYVQAEGLEMDGRASSLAELKARLDTPPVGGTAYYVRFSCDPAAGAVCFHRVLETCHSCAHAAAFWVPPDVHRELERKANAE